MYRDDLEALEARVNTLEAELEAERCSREAAQADARAARAAATEADLSARRSSGFVTRPGLGQHWGGAMVLLLLAITGAMMLSQLCSRSRYAGHLGERLRRARLAAARCEHAANMHNDGNSTARAASSAALSSARSAYVAADYSRAAALASTVLMHDSQNPDALLVYAASQCSQGYAQAARAALRRIRNSARRAIVRSVCKRHGVKLGHVGRPEVDHKAAREAVETNDTPDPLDVGARDPFASPKDATY